MATSALPACTSAPRCRGFDARRDAACSCAELPTWRWRGLLGPVGTRVHHVLACPSRQSDLRRDSILLGAARVGNGINDTAIRYGSVSQGLLVTLTVVKSSMSTRSCLVRFPCLSSSSVDRHFGRAHLV